ncbi:MAG: 50S ribosomal protein L21 [Chitinophagales bacterium]|nr:50S ribosomal protein L21 [Chitinophagales bacterium]
MYAIVDIAGQQFKVEAGKEIFVHRLQGNSGDKVEFGNILLQIDNGSILKTDAPKVSATIVEHLKGDKVIAFKKKRRKGYKKKIGHRQYLTKIKIEAIA